jgi:DNA modification methylase
MVKVFWEVRRVLRNDGTLWLNFGDSYWGGKGQSAHGDPERHIARLAAGKTINQPHQEIGKPGETLNKDGKHPVIKPKDLIGIPWMVAFALRADGWYLRSDIIWSKPNLMPESVTDRPTKAHEYVFLLTKKAKYYYDADAIKEPATTIEERPFGCKSARGYNGKLNIDENAPEQFKHKNLQPDGQPPQTMHLKRAKKQDLTGNPTYTGFNDRYAEKMARNGTNIPGHSGILKADGTPFCDGITRNARTVWTIPTQPTPEAHFATFPEALVEPCIKAGSKIGDTILDPFGGSGTTAKVARRLKRDCILIELNPEYIKIMKKKLRLNEQLVV